MLSSCVVCLRECMEDYPQVPWLSIDRAGWPGHLYAAARLTPAVVCSGAACAPLLFSNRAWPRSFVFTLRLLFIQREA